MQAGVKRLLKKFFLRMTVANNCLILCFTKKKEVFMLTDMTWAPSVTF